MHLKIVKKNKDHYKVNGQTLQAKNTKQAINVYLSIFGNGSKAIHTGNLL